MGKGWSILIPSGPGEKKHLFFVLNDPGDAAELVLASVSSMHSRADTTCLLYPDEHPFIRHESHIDYRHCRTERTGHLERLIDCGYCERREDVSEELIERIIDGAYESRHTKPRILGLLDRRQS